MIFLKFIKFIYTIFILSLLVISLVLSYKLTSKDLDKKILKILKLEFTKEMAPNIKFDFLNFYIKNKKAIKYFKEAPESLDLEVSNIAYNTNKPIVYIYNTHSNEEYS